MGWWPVWKSKFYGPFVVLHAIDATLWLISTQVVATAHDEHGGLAVDVLVRLPDGRAVAVEVDGPSHFARSDDGAGQRLLGRTLIKRRQLAALGWRLLSITRDDWDPLSPPEVYNQSRNEAGDCEAQCEYLRERLERLRSN